MNERGFTEIIYVVTVNFHDFTFFRSEEAMCFARTALIAGDDLDTVDIEVRKINKTIQAPDPEDEEADYDI
ncbi:MAG: hypothetical protein J6T62_06175 [Fibrobacter sp.]|nr:hypothetical protein [Fibrobacter sp.]